MSIDIEEPWIFVGTPTTTVPYNYRKADYKSVLLHEVGHVLGLYHSSFDTAVMWWRRPRGTVARTLTSDDRNGMRAHSAAITNLGSGASDVSGRAPVMLISKTPTPGGFTILKQVGASWTTVPGGATRIAADPQNRAWLVNDVGQIFVSNQAVTTFTWVQGCGRDIGVGNSGFVWLVGCDGALYLGNFNATQNDGQLAPTLGNGWSKQGNNGAAGLPALVNVSANVNYAVASDTNGEIWGYQVSGWSKLVVGGTRRVTDVAGSPVVPGAIWGTAKTGAGLWILNQQPAGMAGTNTPSADQWVGYNLSTVRVSVDTSGRPVFVDNVGSFWTFTK
ncbi:MAG TPA: matrixin family metalloprotease [Polyangiales bacterium]|nr:matrixin family metalloprotease [Polyangiales bacterium]